MNHEPRCIEIPCTCVVILREKLAKTEKLLDEIHTEALKDNIATIKYLVDAVNSLRDENSKLTHKIKDGLSCCCSGCTRHNLILAAHEEIGKDKITVTINPEPIDI